LVRENLRAETGGGFQAQNAGERPEFCSQTALRLANAGIELMAIAACHPFETRRRVADFVRETI
jgi:hypothetical protein